MEPLYALFGIGLIGFSLYMLYQTRNKGPQGTVQKSAAVGQAFDIFDIWPLSWLKVKQTAIKAQEGANRVAIGESLLKLEEQQNNAQLIGLQTVTQTNVIQAEAAAKVAQAQFDQMLAIWNTQLLTLAVSQQMDFDTFKAVGLERQMSQIRVDEKMQIETIELQSRALKAKQDQENADRVDLINTFLASQVRQHLDKLLQESLSVGNSTALTFSEKRKKLRLIDLEKQVFEKKLLELNK